MGTIGQGICGGIDPMGGQGMGGGTGMGPIGGQGICGGTGEGEHGGQGFFFAVSGSMASAADCLFSNSG
ncbi:MAG: hypothetical protein PHV56_05255 [Clostridia bacterium]|nr:hypothetical protein [Clostridia bacterium]